MNSPAPLRGWAAISGSPATPDACRLRELLLRCALGDHDAFAEFYRITSPVLNAWAQTCHQERQAAEDVLVDVYVTIWRRAGTIEPTGAEPVWQWTLDIFDQVLRARGGRRDGHVTV